MKYHLAIPFLLFSSLSAAEYDWKSGNSYETIENRDGSTTTNGINLSNGSIWSSTTDSSGNQRGTDANGNYWQYDKGSGNYYNYGTGKTCYGKGQSRTCY